MISVLWQKVQENILRLRHGGRDCGLGAVCTAGGPDLPMIGTETRAPARQYTPYIIAVSKISSSFEQTLEPDRLELLDPINLSEP